VPRLIDSATAALAALAALALASCAEPSSPTHETVASSSPVLATSSKITTTNLGTLPNGGASVAYAIDPVGATIVGYAYPSTGSGVPQHATRWVFASSRWTIQDLASSFPTGTTGSTAYDVSGSGDIVGFMLLSSGYVHAFLLLKGATQATDLHAPLCNGATDAQNSSYAYAINPGGEVVGVRYTQPDPNNASRRAFHWAAGCMTQLPTLGDPSSAQGTNDGVSDINDYGVAVGMSRAIGGVYQAVRWNRMTDADGTVRWEITQLPVPSGFTSSGASAINNSGEIVGSGLDAAGVRVALCWEPTGEVMTMPTLGGNSAAEGLTEAGDAVGWSYGNAVQNSVRWPAAGGIERLSNGGTVAGANDANNKKQIVGHAFSKTIYATLWTVP
jgi:uncharacterized membrane protein